MLAILALRVFEGSGDPFECYLGRFPKGKCGYLVYNVWVVTPALVYGCNNPQRISRGMKELQSVHRTRWHAGLLLSKDDVLTFI